MITLDFESIFIIALAVWRISYMLTTEDCPFDACVWIRTRLNFGGVFNCIYCLSVWVSALMVWLWYSDLYPIVYVLAISTITIGFHQIIKMVQAIHDYLAEDE